MSLQTWPTEFGKPLMEYDIGFDDPVAREQMERGFKARTMFTEGRYSYSYKFLLSATQYHYFRSWLRHKVANGADWFNMLVRENGANNYREARILEHQEDPAGDNASFYVTLSLEFRTDGIPSESALDTYLAG